MKPLDLYLQVRMKEGRLYPDLLVKDLPVLPINHPHKVEWLARSYTAERFIHYLERLPLPLSILELGCGNGWFSRKISTIPGVNIWGLDRIGTELTQAARLFRNSNTGFLSADIFQSPFVHKSFDVILLASVIQYFPGLPLLITNLQQLLKNHGEIHIIDSPIYEQKELASARERAFTYYKALGIPEMADQYFHHSFDELAVFSPNWLYRPKRWQIRLFGLFGKTVSPFPWLCIR